MRQVVSDQARCSSMRFAANSGVAPRTRRISSRSLGLPIVLRLQVLRAEARQHGVAILRAHLQHRAQLLGEQRCEHALGVALGIASGRGRAPVAAGVVA